MQKWAIILYGIGISGGANAVFEHALFAYSKGVEITIVSDKKHWPEEASWHAGTEYFIYKTFEECKKDIFDVVIATAWETACGISNLCAKKYIYFVQSVESRFFQNENSMWAFLADATYELPFIYITEATWIKKYLMKNYCQKAELVLNGIDKKSFFEGGECISNRSEGKLRVLIEGQVESWLKNIPRTIDLCKKSDADEIWLMTSSKIEAYEGVDRVFSQVAIKDVPKIYRSCDVLVKLSLVEGMFGPPLEMFHCGGTAIIYNIPGCEEYVKHNVNSLVAEIGDEEQIVEYINLLKYDTVRLKKLQKNALITAENWYDWKEASQNFYNIVNKTPPIKESVEMRLKIKGNKLNKTLKYVQLKLGVEQPERKIEKIIQISKENQFEIIIYGAGIIARGFINQLAEHDMAIKGIAVTSLENNPATILGNKVSLITDFQQNKEKYLVCIATNKYYNEIALKLEQAGFRYI